MSNIIYGRSDSDSPWVGVPAIRGNDGEPGKDGKTPVKGTDYFTEAEVSEIKMTIYDQLSKDMEVELEDYAKIVDVDDALSELETTMWQTYVTETEVKALINEALGVIENGSY